MAVGVRLGAGVGTKRDMETGADGTATGKTWAVAYTFFTPLQNSMCNVANPSE